MSDFETQLVLEILDEISDNLIGLEDLVDNIADHGFSESYASELLRFIHSIKGNAQAASLSNMSKLLHKFEDYIIEVNGTDQAFSEDFFDILIRLKKTLDEEIVLLQSGGESNDEFEEMHNLFNQFRKINLKVEPSEKILNSIDAPQILLVDDNVEFLEVFTEQLEMSYEDWDIHTQVDGKSALELTSSSKFDLILTDFFMPEMNGDKFISHIRNGNGPNKETPIIMVTGFKPDFNSDMATWEGVFFLEKPITWKKLELFIHCSFKPVKRVS